MEEKGNPINQEFVSRESSNYRNSYVLIAGISTNEPVQLSPGLTLRPLTCELTIFDLAATGAAGFREWAVLEPCTSACSSEIESANDSAKLPGYDALGRVWLASALLYLRGYCNHLCLAHNTYSWDLVAGRVASPRRPSRYPTTEKLPIFEGGIIEFQFSCWSENKLKRILEKEDIEWVSQQFNTFDILNSKSDKFRLAVEAAVDWRFVKDPRSAIARIWCGIEAICGVSSELVYRIAMICSSLLEERGQKRFERFENVKRLYNFRSKAVHGDTIPPEEMTKTMFSSYNLLRELILFTGKKGHVLSEKDFNKAIFID